ncbi:SEC10/PgrA surface exclusion domain-containing protein [Lactobacillus johnsonii]|uniref:SEC10/PgrA surface exclusion domain-containing protein n=2 Tax=Lactobacillus johnsonii TaxID=33959 RepID=UPI00069F884C|nr:SEC10/PgrA surface exclusion domain-containing protein [Lactobacillus johnsonii]
MKRRTAMLLSALFAAGAIATYSNTAKADTITQPKGQIPEANIETKSTNEGLQQKQVQLGARKSPDLNQKTNKNISTTPVQNNQQLHITHQVEHNNNNWYQMQNKSWLPSSYTTDVKQKQSVQAKQNVQNAQPVQNSNTQTQAQSQGNWHKESADFVTGGVINLRTAPNTNSAIIEAMPTGSTIKYDAYQKIGQYTWLRQPREDGSYGYIVGRNNGVAWGTFKESATKPVQSQNNWHRESADFVTGGVINLRTAPNTNSAIIEAMPTGSTIKYDAYQKIGQYTWLRQPREDGSYGYIVGRNNGVAWGTFKESATKPVESKPAAKPVESKPAAKPVDNKPATKPVDNKPTTKPVDNKPATKPADNKDNIGIITLPAGYTREMVEESSGGKDGLDDTKGKITSLAKKVSEEGMRINNYSNNDARIVDLTNITSEQTKELTDFTLNTINHIRKQMGLNPFVYSNRVQKIADDIAKNYVRDNRDATGNHDVIAITDAMRKDHGLDSITKTVGNDVENMGGWYIYTVDTNHETMGSIKEHIYYNIEQMIFGGYYNGAAREMYHARSLTNPVTTRLGAMYGFSISKIPNSNVATSHFITFSGFDGYDEFLPDFHD